MCAWYLPPQVKLLKLEFKVAVYHSTVFVEKRNMVFTAQPNLVYFEGFEWIPNSDKGISKYHSTCSVFMAVALVIYHNMMALHLSCVLFWMCQLAVIFLWGLCIWSFDRRAKNHRIVEIERACGCCLSLFVCLVDSEEGWGKQKDSTNLCYLFAPYCSQATTPLMHNISLKCDSVT